MAVVNKVEYRNAGNQWVKGAKKEIYQRLIRVGEHLKKEIQRTISTSGNNQPSREGHPPRADTGELRQSITTHTDQKTLTTTVMTANRKAIWMEFGTRGATKGERIRPRGKALTIELTREQAVKIAGQPEFFAKGKRGKVLKRGNSLRARMKRAGIKRNRRGKRKRGQFVMLRANVMRAPIRPRPFFRRTVNEQKREIRRILNRKIKVAVTLVPANLSSAGLT